jgi:hypothetical protein
VAILDAWPNLSQREKASVFVTARTMAMTVAEKKEREKVVSKNAHSKAIRVKTYQPN